MSCFSNGVISYPTKIYLFASSKVSLQSASIILFSFFGWPNIIARIIMRILCIPIVAGISYEIIKFLGKYDNILSKIVAYPGMMLQHITTNEPDDEQLEVAIKALKAVI